MAYRFIGFLLWIAIMHQSGWAEDAETVEERMQAVYRKERPMSDAIRSQALESNKTLRNHERVKREARQKKEAGRSGDASRMVEEYEPPDFMGELIKKETPRSRAVQQEVGAFNHQYHEQQYQKFVDQEAIRSKAIEKVLNKPKEDRTERNRKRREEMLKTNDEVQKLVTADAAKESIERRKRKKEEAINQDKAEKEQRERKRQKERQQQHNEFIKKARENLQFAKGVRADYSGYNSQFQPISRKN